MLLISGIVRSGLTVTMQMLNAGGYPCAGEYPAFEPFGLGEIPWEKLKGKAIKFIDPQIQDKPQNDYKIILLSRDLKQQAKSVNKFGSCFGLPKTKKQHIIKGFKEDYKKNNSWAKKHECLNLKFEDIINDPTQTARRIQKFTGKILDIGKMSRIVVKRSTDCYPTMLEIKLIKKSKKVKGE